MNSILNRNTFLFKEKVRVFGASNQFNIYNPENQEILMTCNENGLNIFVKLLRFTDYRGMSPFHFEVKTSTGEKLMTIKRGFTLISSHVKVLDAQNQLVGIFKQSLFSIGGKFKAFDAQDNFLFTLQGKWTSWNFKLLAENVEFAQVSKKWAGIGKEFFTSSDNYVLTINEQVPSDNPLRLLILAAVACIDLVLKE